MTIRSRAAYGPVWHWVRVAIAITSVLCVVAPLLYVLRLSVERLPGRLESQLTVPTNIGPNAGFTFDNFRHVWNYGLRDAFGVSLQAVLVGGVIATGLATMAGFAFAKLLVPARGALLAILACGLAVPIPVIAVPLISQGVRFGFTNSTLGLGVCYGSVFSIFGMLFMRAYFLDFPDTLIEAAVLDGCTTFGAFWRVVLPLAAPAVATVFVLNVLVQWAELLLGLVLLPSNHTVSVSIATFQNAYGTGGPTLAAAAIAAALPVVVLMVAGQRVLRAGILSGALKA